MSPERPTLDLAAGNIPRTNHHIDSGQAVGGFHTGQNRPEVTGVVAEIGIHIERVAVTVFDGIAHARDRGRAQTQLTLAVQTVDPRIARGRRSSHQRPVPSGELSSMTSRWAAGSSAEIASTSRGRFSISL